MNRLRELREEAILTVHELSELSGVSEDTITKIENGYRTGRPSTLRKLAQALDTTPQNIKGAQKSRGPVEPGIQRKVRLPLDIDAIAESVGGPSAFTNALDFRNAIDEVAAARLESAYTREEVFEFKDELLKEASRLADEQRGSREEIRRIPPEDINWRLAIIENLNVVLRVLEKTAGRQLRSTGEKTE